MLFNITANADSQIIYIYRISDDNGYVYNNNLRKYSVKTANISLSIPASNFDNFIIKEAPRGNDNFSKGAYYTNSEPLTISSSTQYFLNVNINSYTITGQVTTPDDFNILTPSPNSTFNVNDNINISWTSSCTAKGYIINAIDTVTASLFNDSLFTYTYMNSFITQDTSFIYDLFLVPKGILKIDILAFDKNYYNHIIKNYQSSGIEGAYGYFAASVLKSVTVNIK